MIDYNMKDKQDLSQHLYLTFTPNRTGVLRSLDIVLLDIMFISC